MVAWLLLLAGSARADQRLVEAAGALERGADVEAARLGRSAKPRDDGELVIARVEVRTGRIAEAEQRLRAILARDPRHVDARIELGRLLRATGRPQLAKPIWNGFFDDYEQGRIDKRSAHELCAVAIAARYLGSYQDANAVFKDAVDADPSYEPAHVEWGDTFLEKYAVGEAEQDALAALKLRPDDPEAHLLLARVKLEQSYDVAAALKELTAALRVNPRHTGALALRAELCADNEEYAAAGKLARAALAVDPKDEGAHAVLAAIAALHDDAKAFAVERDAVLAVDPRASGFFHRVAESLVKQHRYVEANDLEQEALKLVPDDAVALGAIAQNWLRLGGHEKEGLEALHRAWARDDYNVRTHNLLNLFEDCRSARPGERCDLGVIPKEYETVAAGPFQLRVPKQEKEVLEKIVPPMVSEEWKELTARYGFTPEGPLAIELYADPSHYAVRTVGLPGLEALGVTFGKIVTGRSPSEGRFNWGMMLWHEVGHVFSIQLSRARVPRWFTEGLAEYETARHDPSWTRHTHAELAEALQGGRLLSVGELNTGFLHARTVSGMVVAYHEAAEAVAFLIRRFGFEKAVEALRLYGAGKETPAVLRAVTGLDVPAFDAAFREALRARLKVYEGQFILRSSDFADLDGLAAQAKERPADGRVQALYALALLHDAHDLQRAEEQLKKARAAGAPTKEALFAAAEIILAGKDWAAGQQALETLIKAGGDGYDARMKLAETLVHLGRPAEALREAALAKTLDPENSEPYELSAKILLSQKREDEAIPELFAAARLDVHDPSLPALLVEKLAARGRWKEVREAAALGAWITPMDAAMRTQAGRAALALSDPAGAVRELEIALACAPKSPGSVRGLLARALDAVGDHARARREATEALKLAPEDPDARAVLGGR